MVLELIFIAMTSDDTVRDISRNKMYFVYRQQIKFLTSWLIKLF